MTGLEESNQVLGQRMTGLEESNQVLGQRMTGLEESNQVLGQRMTGLEESNQEILEAIQSSFTEVEQRMNGKFEQIDRRFEQVDRRFEQIDNRFERMDKRFDKIDERLAINHGDLVAAIRNEDAKVITLTNKLGARNVLPAADVAEVLNFEPFPKTV
jgi:phage shock protein A